jgi:putative serine protease PepD
MAPGPLPTVPSSRPGRGRGGVLIGVVALVAVLAVVAALVARGGWPWSDGDNRAGAPPKPSPSPSKSALPTVADIYQQVGPSVAVVRTAKGALGTGVIAADDGTIVTADHVISDGSAITVYFADGTKSEAAVASANPKTDIAMLTPATLPQPVVPATIGGSAKIGGPVVAIGNPLGLTYSVSSGVVSGLNRTATTENGKFSGLIQFDASVNPGSSGGPLLDGNGDVIGVVVSIAEPAGAATADGTEAFAGIAFAVPIGTALGGAGSGTGRGPQL